MHLYFMTRGIKHRVDQFITELQGKYLPIPMTDKATGETKTNLVQVAVRPIQLWEVVFPKEHLNTMVNTFWPKDKGFEYGIHHKHLKKYVSGLRMMLGAKPMPKRDTIFSTDFMPIFTQDVNIMAIGIKEDSTTSIDVDGVSYKTEAL